MTTPASSSLSATEKTQKSYFDVVSIATFRTIHSSRSSRTWKNSKGQMYLRGIMVIRGIHVDYVVYDTINRMDGTPWLRPGVYRAAIEKSVDKKNPGRRQIHPVHGQRNSEGHICNFLIHPSEPPRFLTGCVSPGDESARGFKASEAALETIFRCLGSFEVGREVLSNVSGTMPGRGGAGQPPGAE